ncbi:MAG: Asp-tRNA(Asn)/Glu-tRNA(Gln) amidotransferase subunit GatC [Bdellovibrionales bacterium]|nr:Asp-tRNA(Asn)/Glu-tRNA(Gln) amidotransferase subunit GatC [Bdellovibrionales bacterium]
MVNEEEVKKLANLARLYLNPEEVNKLTSDLNRIFSYMEVLNKVELNDIQPLSHVHGITNIYREDQNKELLTAEEALSNVPDKSGTFIKVPIIIDQDAGE